MPQTAPNFNHAYASLPERFYANAQPADYPHAKLIQINDDLASELGFDLDWLHSEAGLAMLSGQILPPSAQPIAQAYAGHQFGGFVPQLGDGRAILLGEMNGHDVQLKGSGLTKYSRGGDGKSALGPVIREYLVSEAMHALGVPTTRALAAVATQEAVFRQFGPEPGGIFTRVARSHVRVGTFQYFAAQQDTDALQILTHHCTDHLYPDAQSALELLENIVLRQARLIAHWMSLGFIHGVMNTDNCSISGDTIDYGPCAFMDTFHPKCVFSSIDRQGRYAWENQAKIAHWNLTRLAEALIPVIDHDVEKAEEKALPVLAKFAPEFKSNYLQRFRSKLGLADCPESFIDSTLSHMADTKKDFTVFFSKLTQLAAHDAVDSYFSDDWLALWRAEGKADVTLMQANNPVLIPRNHQVEKAIQHANDGDLSVFHRLNQAWKNPFSEQADYNDLEIPPTDSERVRETFCGT